MPIYRYTNDAIQPIASATFSDLGITERADLQRLLRDQIEIIAPDTLVIAEEFGNWEDSRRRIDLLAIDRDANLVVIELKRTEDGGHMDLQALRYAAMVSTMTFEQAVSTFEAYLARRNDERNAQQSLLDFLQWDEQQDDDFGTEVRIVLASAEFSSELTTSVLWLNLSGLNITCVHLRPYGSSGDVLLDVQQVIPLPEAEDYQVRLRERHERERASRRASRDSTRFNVTVGDTVHPNLAKRDAVFTVLQAICSTGISPADIGTLLSWRTKLFLTVDGSVDSATFETLAQQSPPFYSARWFCSNAELLHADGKTYALTTRWGPRSEHAMQQMADQYSQANVSFERVTS
ncbi:MAG: hypothetical protein ABGZ53_17875 [Fuerstiella sp.]